MADICVIFASENEGIVRKLVNLLKINWEVWWSDDIRQGDWQKEIRQQITKSKAVVPIFSRFAEGKDIFRDELDYARRKGKLIFPFAIEDCEAPLGFGTLNRTEAFGWNGDEKNTGYLQLVKKILLELSPSKNSSKTSRIAVTNLRKKQMELPGFVFSLSSYDTQIRPEDGINLLRFLNPSACLISAYDVWNFCKDKEKKKNFFNSVEKLRESSSTLFLDSGNYEAYRKHDLYSGENRTGWSIEKYREIASVISPDISFAFDEPNPEGAIEQIADDIIRNFHQDEDTISKRNFPICPIIHLPRDTNNLSECAVKLISKVTLELDPVMVAIPERELGAGIIERFRTVRDIRRSLNEIGKYYPLHLLGTGNPISMIAFSAAGADSFDGLEWCRTVADYSNGHLFHFSHYDCFDKHYFSRVRSSAARMMISNPDASYIIKVASYNFDYFSDSAKTMRDMILAGQIEHLLKNVPNIGTMLFEELKK